MVSGDNEHISLHRLKRAICGTLTCILCGFFFFLLPIHFSRAVRLGQRSRGCLWTSLARFKIDHDSTLTRAGTKAFVSRVHKQSNAAEKHRAKTEEKKKKGFFSTFTCKDSCYRDGQYFNELCPYHSYHLRVFCGFCGKHEAEVLKRKSRIPFEN